MRYVLLCLLASVLSFSAQAQLRLPQFFGDQMVLQRNKPIHIWGWGNPSDRIKVDFANQQTKTKVRKDGSWAIQLEALPANTQGRDLTISTKDSTITLQDILIGDVWICSGQSNMNYTMDRFDYAQAEADRTNLPLLRMMTVKKEFSLVEETDLTAGGWKKAVGPNIFPFSATAYFFGKNLHQELGVPIGLIATSWGGTLVESWLPESALADFPGIDSVFQARKAEFLAQDLEARKSKWKRIVDSVAASGIGLEQKWYLPEHDDADWSAMVIPMEKGNALFEGMDGSLWLKKEFEIPTPFRDRDLTLKLGQIDDFDQVWVNGHPVGESRRKGDWRGYTVEKTLLKPGKNHITLRIIDYGGSGGWVTNPYFINIYPVGDPKGYYLLSGDWKYKKGMRFKTPLDLPKIPSRIFNLIKTIPSCLYNQMIHPLTKLSITGAIWYQGESNTMRGYEYSQLFPAMISGWRQAFDQGDFPFLFVQLPNYKGKPRGKHGALPNWPELRQAQRLALKLPQTGMAVTLDIGLGGNIHPPNKQDVGKRLALAARGIQYGEDLAYRAPAYASHKMVGDSILVQFSDVAGGLVNSNNGFMGPLLNHFEIAGQDGIFHPALAKIVAPNQVLVYGPKVKTPAAVRYAWKNNPERINFYGGSGLPVAPFRTGDWAWETREARFVKSLE